MELSYYNEIIEHKEKFYLYNTYKNTLIQVSTDLLEKLEKNKFSAIQPSIIQKLKELGFIYEDANNEIEVLKLSHNFFKYDRSQICYILYPTLTCNLSCSYCFEKVERHKITEKNFLILKNFLTNQAKNNKNTYIHLRWSGGEPLLIWNNIREINMEVQELCVRNNIDFSSSLSTNGTLITEKIALELKNAFINDITISIDGPRDIHNKRRFFSSNKGSYNDVIRGINNLSKCQSVILRINIDKDNYTHYSKLLCELNELLMFKSNVSIYFKPVVSSLGCELDETMYSDSEYFKIEKKLIKETKESGFKIEYHPGFKTATRCPAYQIASYMIDPELNLFKCSKQIGIKEKRVGFINDDSNLSITDPMRCLEFVNLNPFENPECITCKVLPLCNGKCPIRSQELRNTKDSGCIPEKGTIIEKVKHFLIQNELSNV